MRTLQGWLLPVFMLPMAVYAQEATVKEVHDAPAVRQYYRQYAAGA